MSHSIGVIEELTFDVGRTLESGAKHYKLIQSSYDNYKLADVTRRCDKIVVRAFVTRVQLQGVKEENTFSQVFDNSTKKPPHFNFKVPTFLLFDGNCKTLPACEVSQL